MKHSNEVSDHVQLSVFVNVRSRSDMTSSVVYSGLKRSLLLDLFIDKMIIKRRMKQPLPPWIVLNLLIKQFYEESMHDLNLVSQRAFKFILNFFFLVNILMNTCMDGRMSTNSLFNCLGEIVSSSDGCHEMVQNIHHPQNVKCFR